MTAEDLRVDAGIAGRGRRCVRAVAVVVASRVELVGLGADHLAIRLEHLARTDQLVVAGERNVVRVVGGVAELARQRRSSWRRVGSAVVGEARVLRPDAGVDDADHDAFAGEPALPRAAALVRPRNSPLESVVA